MASLPEPIRPQGTGTGARVALGLSLTLAGGCVVLPAVVMVVLALVGAVIRGAAEVLENTGGLADETFWTSARAGGLLALAMVLTAVCEPLFRAAGGTSRPHDSARSHRWTAASAAVLAAITALLAFLEWGGNDALPDVAAGSATLALTTCLAAAGTLLVVWLGWRLVRGLYRLGSRRAFLGGAIAALGLVASGAGAHSIAQAVEEGAELPARELNSDALLDLFRFAADYQGEEPEPLRLAATGGRASGSPAAGDARTRACFESLGPQRDGDSDDFSIAMKMLQRRFGYDPELARDLAMEALINVCAMHGIKPYDKVAAAFVKAAHNEGVDEVKRREKTRTISTLSDRWQLVSCAPRATDDVRLDTEYQAVAAAMDQLDPAVRRAIGLKMTGFSHIEVFKETGAPRHTVDNAFRRVQKRVKDACYSNWLE